MQAGVSHRLDRAVILLALWGRHKTRNIKYGIKFWQCDVMQQLAEHLLFGQGLQRGLQLPLFLVQPLQPSLSLHHSGQHLC